jgi:hypothetical protein
MEVCHKCRSQCFTLSSAVLFCPNRHANSLLQDPPHVLRTLFYLEAPSEMLQLQRSIPLSLPIANIGSLAASEIQQLIDDVQASIEACNAS